MDTASIGSTGSGGVESWLSVDRDCSALAGFFQAILNELKSGGPLWEEFLTKASKLQHALKSTLLVFASFLDTFQRLADAATNATGATKEVGAALTRVSLRHRAIEARVKNLTECLATDVVVPLQERLDDWRRSQTILQRQHAKEYKRAVIEVRKRREGALRLQRKARKAPNDAHLRQAYESALTDAWSRSTTLLADEREWALRALAAQRSRFCAAAAALAPLLDEEALLGPDLARAHEAAKDLARVANAPSDASPNTIQDQQILEDVRLGARNGVSDDGAVGAGGWAWQTPPSSPASSSRGSLCSVSSINSSSSSNHLAHPPSKTPTPDRTPSTAVKSQEWPSADACAKPTEETISSNRGTPDVPDGPEETEVGSLRRRRRKQKSDDRPHTISAAYERNSWGRRPPLTTATFEPDSQAAQEGQSEPKKAGKESDAQASRKNSSSKDCVTPTDRETPTDSSVVPDFHKAPADMIVPQPLYSNMSELRSETGSRSRDTLSHPRTQSLSTSAYQASISTGGSLRRRPGPKPLPPVRLSSAVSATSKPGSSPTAIPTASTKATTTNTTVQHYEQPLLLQQLQRQPLQLQQHQSVPEFHLLMETASAPTLSTTDGDSEATTPLAEENDQGGSLPPPPVFLLTEESQSEEEGSKTPENTLETDVRGERLRECLLQRSVSVSDAVRSLQQKRHQPPSPASPRRRQPQSASVHATPSSARPSESSSTRPPLLGPRPQMGLRSSLPQPCSKSFSVQPDEPRRPSVDGQRAALISSLNAKLASSNPALGPQQQAGSPRMGRTRAASLTAEPEATARSVPPGQSNFIQSLNMALAHRGPSPASVEVQSLSRSPRMRPRRIKGPSNGVVSPACSPQPTVVTAAATSNGERSDRASWVRQWISSRKGGNAVEATQSIRESLLDQIRRGKTLRRARQVADRSAPRVA